MKASEYSGRHYPATLHNNPGDLLPKQFVVETSNHCFCIVKNIFILIILSFSLIVSGLQHNLVTKTTVCINGLVAHSEQIGEEEPTAKS
jgi:hypothetical protein